MRALRKFLYQFFYRYELDIFFKNIFYRLTKPYRWFEWKYIRQPRIDRYLAKSKEDKRY